MACTICGREKCVIKGKATGRASITSLLGTGFSVVSFKLTLNRQARAVVNEYSVCEQQRLIYLMKTERPLFLQG